MLCVISSYLYNDIREQNIYGIITVDNYRYRLHELTAEIGEAHYGDVRLSYAETVQSVGLQIHWNMSVALMYGHKCANVFRFQPYKHNKMDHIIVDKRMHCYQVMSATNTHYLVRRYLCQKVIDDGNLDLKWSTV